MATITLSGEVISDDWAELYRYFGFEAGYFCPGDVRRAVEALEQDEALVLEINSIGGHVDAGSEIYSILQKCPNHTRAEVQSLAASAASYMIMACDEIVIAAPAQFMIHCASWAVGGNRFDHEWAAEQLASMDESILDTYCLRCGEEHREQLREAMEAETYLSARACLELGLADRLLGEAAPAEDNPLAMVASVHTNTVRAMRTLPDITELMARKEAENAQLEHNRNLLAIERARYT